MYQFYANAQEFMATNYVTIPVTQYDLWQKEFEKAQVELRELRRLKDEQKSERMAEHLAKELNTAKRRGDSLAHMRKTLHKKMRLEKEEHETVVVNLQTKLLEKHKELDKESWERRFAQGTVFAKHFYGVAGTF